MIRRGAIYRINLNCVEKVAFPRSISSHHDIVPWVEWFDNRLLSIGFKSLNNHLLYVHIHLIHHLKKYIL